MIKRHHSHKLLLLFLVFILFLSVRSFADGIQFDTLLSEKSGIPLSFCFSSPAYGHLSQFGENRTEDLNRLLQHFSLEIHTDESAAYTSVLIDNDPVYSVTETSDSGLSRKLYSLEPDTVIEYPDISYEQQETFSYYLNHHFFRINSLLDDFYPFFEKLVNAFPDFSKSESVNVSLKTYGKAVRRITIRIPSDYARNSFLQDLSLLSDSDQCTSFFSSLVFDGVQKFVILLNADNHIIRINYDGVVGITGESLRHVSLNWKMLRNECQKADDLTMKSPSVKGYDKYNMTYHRDLNLSEPDRHTLDWSLELDRRRGDLRQRIQFSANLAFEQNTLLGKLVFSQKKDGNESKTIIVPSITKENESEYFGSLEITEYSGKIINSRLNTMLRIAVCSPVIPPDPDTVKVIDSISEEGMAAEERIQSRINSILLRKLISLPEEDTAFFRKDIPSETWDSFIQPLF